MRTYFMCLFFLCLFYPIMAQNTPKSGNFTLAPRVVVKGQPTGTDKNHSPRIVRDWWFERTVKIIKRMSHEVMMDTDTKFSNAKYLKEKYEKSVTFLIGSTAASIMDEFESMLIIYRRYSNKTSYLKKRKYGEYDLRGYNEGLIAIQGLYHQIRIEEHLFNNAVEKLQNKRLRMRKYRENMPASLRSKDNQQNTLRTRHNRENMPASLRSKDNQQNTLRTRHNQQDILRTSNNQQNILRTIDNQQNTNRFPKASDDKLQVRSFGLTSSDQREVSDAMKVSRQNNVKSVKKPLWVYKEAEEDKF